MALYDAYRSALAQGRSVVLATVIAGPDGIGSKLLVRPDGSIEGSPLPAELANQVVADALDHLRDEAAGTVSYQRPEGAFEVFFDVYPAPPQLVIVGAGHVAVPLARFGKELGYRVVVTDARAAFARPERFPEADQVLKGWPQDVLPALDLDESTYVVLLSHDPKFDEPTLDQVLPSAVRYIGAIGSRKTQRSRFERLRRQGYTENQLGRLFGPVGLDIGGRTPEETAIAILAEITAVRRGRPGGFMRDRERRQVP